MREWIEELACYMSDLDKTPSPLNELSEEVHQTAIDTDVLLAASDQLQSAYTSLIGKLDHDHS